VIILLLRLLFTVLAGSIVWAIWRRTADDPAAARIVGLGLAARVLGGTVLFWISYLHLPFAELLQLGRGFWFFAPDGVNYYDYALAAADDGVRGILAVDPALPSRFYIQSIATLLHLLGPSPAVAILLNAFAYLVTCWLLVAWSRRAGVGRLPLLIALGAVSFFPSWILWTFQPLKDTIFLALMVAYAFIVSIWLDDASDTGAFRRTAAILVGLGVLLYAIAGVRWYVAVLMTGASALAWLPSLVSSSERRTARAVGVMAYLTVAAAVIPISAGPYLPDFGRMLFRPQSAEEMGGAASAMSAYLLSAREGSLATSAGTLILSPGDPTGTSIAPRVASMFLPRAVGTYFGLVRIDGGRGLWAMAELDTVFLDLTLVAVGWVLWRQHRRGFAVRPIFVLVAVFTVGLAAALCYQTANFGTQFRLRSMVAIGFVLLLYTFGPPRTQARAHSRERRNGDVKSGVRALSHVKSA
jgi:hypothetical protein